MSNIFQTNYLFRLDLAVFFLPEISRLFATKFGINLCLSPPWALQIALYFNFINYSQKPLPWTLPDLRWQLKTADFLSAWHTAYRLDYIWYL